ncbi:MliC family protein [Deinococcus ficus]|uniref:C-type lysozyme inhibitor domain-containing protein n=1 Tax=Deinococcus ficus TaxID=317577 RepID=A0A221T1C7_9DEIO|nr:MliC family protein [Deinococcus ficus]ASN82694.1 hypothetical protein DFI_16160 [Deinococcus ficus]
MILRNIALTVAAMLGGTGFAAPAAISYRTFHYTCDGSRKVSVSYVNFGMRGTQFAVLTWNGRQYGLASAVSASGARYAALAGPAGSSGLEWWEHQGEATLSAFVGPDSRVTRPLLTGCRTGR